VYEDGSKDTVSEEIKANLDILGIAATTDINQSRYPIQSRNHVRDAQIQALWVE